MNIQIIVLGALAAIVAGTFSLCAVALTGLFNLLNNLRIEEHKKNLSLELEVTRNTYQQQLETLKSELAREKDKNHFKFTKYHECQLEAIKSVYAGLIDAETETILTADPGYYGQVEPEMTQRLERLKKRLSEVGEILSKNSIFLNSDTKDKLREILQYFYDYFQLTNEVLIAMNIKDHDSRLDSGKRRRAKYIEMNEKIPALKEALEKNLTEVLISF